MHNSGITFVTGNDSKAKYASLLLGISVSRNDIDLPEIQSLDLQSVVDAKLVYAYERIQKPIIVEDVSLEFGEMKRLPGTFIKFFEKELGLDYLCTMLNGKNRVATAKCIIGFTNGIDKHFFTGSQSGTIAVEPCGNEGFGWDRIFISGQFQTKTNAELNEIEYAEYFTTMRRFDLLKEYLINHGYIESS